MIEPGARCSAQARQLEEPLAGTAPHALLWVLIEQPGPWGREPLTQSHLDPAIGRSLVAWGANAPVRIGLIRRPGRHADSHVDGVKRTVLLAGTQPGNSWLQSREVLDPRELLSWELTDLTIRAQPSGFLAEAVLVCTNARRDQCCAILGRPLAEQFSSQITNQGVQVWETSHLGGHRFAPTFVTLPSGYLFGGAAAASRSVDACRGRSSLAPPAQAAELAVARALGWSRPAALLVDGDPPLLSVTVPETGQTFLVAVEDVPLPARPESCIKTAVPGRYWRASITR